MSRLQFWESHIEAWQHSGLSQTAYCREQGINYHSFTVRLSQYRKKRLPGLPALIPVQVRPNTPPSEPVGNIRLTHGASLHIDLPSNTSAAWLAELLTCLG
jgi:hypothetical protein